MATHLRSLGFVLFVAGVLYLRPTTSYFCGYDDFAAMHRAQFADARNPKAIFNTTDFGQPKYRPLERGLFFVAYNLAGPNPAIFRGRNLLAHLIAICAIYGIAWMLFRTRPVAMAAALFYAVHPIANQAILGAVWSIASVYALLLLSFFIFLRSLEVRRWWLPLMVSIVLMWVCLFIYEATIVFFGFVFGYLILLKLRGRSLPPRYAAITIGLSTFAVGSLFLIRHLFVGPSAGLVPIPIVIRNTAMYVIALLTPVDMVWANTVFGTPLPSEVTLSRTLLITVACVAVAVLFAVVLLASRPWVRQRASSIDWLEIAFLAGAVLFGLSPFLGFTDHPSETYLYMPVGLYAIILSRLLFAFSKYQKIFWTIAGALSLLFFSATWTRSQRVVTCAAAVENILTHLPLDRWRTGDHNIRLATLPEENRPLSRYGLYGYRGLSGLDPNVPGIHSAQLAVQILTGNENLKVTIVDPSAMRDCSQPASCFWISDNGSIRDAGERNTVGSKP